MIADVPNANGRAARPLMTHLWRLLIALLYSERLLKHWAVRRFFLRQPAPSNVPTPELVSILQPILSGDPALADCLAQNLEAKTSYRREFIWLLDADDYEAQRICAALRQRHSTTTIHMVTLPAPPAHHNPKLVKLQAGSTLAQGAIICVLDDDTMLPDGALERALPLLAQPDVGLVFGLPYYVSFENLWSSLVAMFVNSSSLMTYVPFAALHEPVTINGMFYAMRRTTLQALDNFTGLEEIVADDFAVAAALRRHGYRLALSPLCHPIRTTVEGPRHYANLIQRWLIFPRESLMRHLTLGERALLYALVALPLVGPWLALAALRWAPVAIIRRLALGYFLLGYAIFAQQNRAYLNNATPVRAHLLLPIVQLLLPAQFIAALLAPRRIIWRGHVMAIARGGRLHMIRRRRSATSDE
ncbi:MAG: glycosyltransferase [Candidatus Viridilinea halotolerans]|uniref:Glycosyltransferase n=1 Tax=Candidatus Viridilinea halotolerans TaxID=2491704 RepID=A0A426TUF1_9CHLR|nr:MAG: glycosyltransferase [Candidatus Viridilinea halotolerans]